MAVTVHVGFSRKVGEPNFGSRGASVQLEVELYRSAIEDGERFRSAIIVAAITGSFRPQAVDSILIATAMLALVTFVWVSVLFVRSVRLIRALQAEITKRL
jgi:hypothetical protein